MPVHYDPARIRKRFCPAGHDKYVVGVKVTGTPRKGAGRASICNSCQSNGWQNPRNAINMNLSRIRRRKERKIEQIKKLLKELGETNA